VSEPIARIDGLTDDQVATINRLLERLERKTPRNLIRAQYYDGKRALRQMSRVVPPHYNRLGIVLGWNAKAVDLLARRCNLDGYVWPDGDLAARIADALGIELQLAAERPMLVEPRSIGAVHARCSGYVSRRLRREGWQVRRQGYDARLRAMDAYKVRAQRRFRVQKEPELLAKVPPLPGRYR
jgi:hypothetical protein